MPALVASARSLTHVSALALVLSDRLGLGRPGRRFSVPWRQLSGPRRKRAAICNGGISTGFPQSANGGGGNWGWGSGIRLYRGRGGSTTVCCHSRHAVLGTDDRSPAAPEPRGRAVRARGHPHRSRCGHRGRRVPAPGGLLPAGERPHLRGDPRPVRASRADRHRHGRRGARASRGPGGDRRARISVEPQQRDPDRGPRRAVRPDRRAQGRPPQPDRRGRTDRRHRLRGSGRDPGGDRPRRSRALLGQPKADRRGLQPAQGAPPRCLRSARLPPRPPWRDLGRPDRLHRPRCAHDRPPAERPDRRRGPTVRRQDELRAQHRRARGRERGSRASACSASR